MTDLVDSLLELSWVSRASLKIEKVDLSALAEKILVEYREKEPDRKIEAAVAPGLACRGDRRLLGAVLDNLLSNAWKFTKNCVPARIEFGTLQEGSAPAYFVRDNGCGFDVPQDMARLFLPFQRFHSAEEYAGTGIGLATVNRIIVRHGGKVWLESAPGKGTTVYFTLPGG
jgi:light-regulated signal transduction histidine kinase (bacteriophytochrome)